MGTLDQAAAAAGAPASAQSPAPAAAAPEQTQTAPVQQQRPTQPTAAKKPAGGAGVPEEPATPEEQQEFDRVMQAVATVLYSNEETSNAIVDQILPDDKVGSTAKASMLFAAVSRMDTFAQSGQGCWHESGSERYRSASLEACGTDGFRAPRRRIRFI